VLEPAVFAPEPRLAELLEEALLGSLEEELPERPLPEVELESLRGEELLEPAPLLEPLPVLEPLLPLPDAPPALLADSRTSETVTSGAPWLDGKVTMATPNPFCTPLVEDEPLRPLLDEPPDELPLRPLLEEPPDELPLRPLPLELELLRSALLDPVPLLDDEPIPPEDDELPGVLLVSPPLCEESLGLAVLLEEPVRPDDDDEEPIPPALDELPERPPLDEPLASERSLLLPLELPLLDEFTGQFESSAGFWTSPCTMIISLN